MRISLYLVQMGSLRLVILMVNIAVSLLAMPFKEKPNLGIPNEILGEIEKYLNFEDYLNMERSYHELIPLSLDFLPDLAN